jgi:hypothetical protein
MFRAPRVRDPWLHPRVCRTPGFYRAAICVGAPIGAGLDELIEQIAVRGMDRDAVEIGGLCVLGRALILRDDEGHLFDSQCARPHERNKFTFAALVLDEGRALRYDGRRRDRLSGCSAGCEMRLGAKQAATAVWKAAETQRQSICNRSRLTIQSLKPNCLSWWPSAMR